MKAMQLQWITSTNDTYFKEPLLIHVWNVVVPGLVCLPFKGKIIRRYIVILP